MSKQNPKWIVLWQMIQMNKFSFGMLLACESIPF